MTKQTIQKTMIASVGVIAVVLGTVGIFLPLLPTTPFLLLAAGCFLRSSRRLYDGLMNHKWLGPYIRNYRDHGAMTRRAKVSVLVLLWGSIGYSVVVVSSQLWLRLLLVAIAVGVTVHLLSLKTLKNGVCIDP